MSQKGSDDCLLASAACFDRDGADSLGGDMLREDLWTAGTRSSCVEIGFCHFAVGQIREARVSRASLTEQLIAMPRR